MKIKQILAFLFFSALNCSGQAAAQISVFEDLLYWHASQETTSVWAYQFTLNPSNNVNDPVNQGTYFTEPNVHFGWSPGVRLGMQYTPDNYFDTELYWTNFSTKTTDSITVPDGQLLLPQFFNGFTTTNVYNAAQLYWHLEMNMIDAMIGRQFNPLDSLSVHPFVGIKGGTINQTINSAWQMLFFDIPLYHADEHLKNNFSGIGPSLSLNSLWTLFKGFNIRSDFQTALLWGYWKVNDSFNRPVSLFYPQKYIESNTNNSLGAFMASYFLGFEWTFQVRATVTLKAGYEMQFWNNQLRLPVFQALPIHGDLTLQGGTCGIYINL